MRERKWRERKRIERSKKEERREKRRERWIKRERESRGDSIILTGVGSSCILFDSLSNNSSSSSLNSYNLACSELQKKL